MGSSKGSSHLAKSFCLHAPGAGGDIQQGVKKHSESHTGERHLQELIRNLDAVFNEGGF